MIQRLQTAKNGDIEPTRAGSPPPLIERLEVASSRKGFLRMSSSDTSEGLRRGKNNGGITVGPQEQHSSGENTEERR